jgi:formate dehydrogenase maturation protein FdhE
MAIGENDELVLSALSEARAQHEELAELLNFYYDLYRVQFEAKEGLPAPQVRDEMAMRWRLEGGIPQLSFDQLGLNAESFVRLVDGILGVLLRHNPGWQIDGEDGEPEELVAMARQVFETWDTLTSPGPDAVDSGKEAASQPANARSLAVGFALAPYLQQAADVILPQLDQALWTKSYCPICGGRPNFALLKEPVGARHLMCSRCNCLWAYRRVGCPFCESQEKQTYYASDDGIYRLYVCPDCNRYLKTMDLRGLYRFDPPVVARLLTVGMDLAAQQEGYGT